MAIGINFQKLDDPHLHWTEVFGAPVKEYKGDRWQLHQASSGGIAWDSHNHVNKEGKVSLPFKGYRIPHSLSSIS